MFGLITGRPIFGGGEREQGAGKKMGEERKGGMGLRGVGLGDTFIVITGS